MLNNFKLNKRKIFLVLIGMYAFISIIDYWFLYRFVHVGQLFDIGTASTYVYSHFSPLFYALRRNRFVYFSVLSAIYIALIYKTYRPIYVKFEDFMGKVYSILLFTLANFRLFGDLFNNNICNPVQYHLFISLPSYIVLMLTAFLLRKISSGKVSIKILTEKYKELRIYDKYRILVLGSIAYLYLSIAVLFWLQCIGISRCGLASYERTMYDMIDFFTTVNTKYIWGKYLTLIWSILVCLNFAYICHSLTRKNEVTKGLLALCEKNALLIINIKFFEAFFVEWQPLFINFDSLNVLPTYLLLTGSVKLVFSKLKNEST